MYHNKEVWVWRMGGAVWTRRGGCGGWEGLYGQGEVGVEDGRGCVDQYDTHDMTLQI